MGRISEVEQAMGTLVKKTEGKMEELVLACSEKQDAERVVKEKLMLQLQQAEAELKLMEGLKKQVRGGELSLYKYIYYLYLLLKWR